MWRRCAHDVHARRHRATDGCRGVARLGVRDIDDPRNPDLLRVRVSRRVVRDNLRIGIWRDLVRAEWIRCVLVIWCSAKADSFFCQVLKLTTNWTLEAG